MTQLRYIDGIQQALHQEMTTDDSVRVMGEDVTLGGPFGATKGLVEDFGESRVINTPISEATIVGMAVGMAINQGFFARQRFAQLQFSLVRRRLDVEQEMVGIRRRQIAGPGLACRQYARFFGSRARLEPDM